MTASKLCPRCNQVLPLTDFPRWKAGKLGRGSYCLQCGREYSAERRRAQGVKPRPECKPLQPGETKECRHCHRALAATEFHPSKRNADGLRSYCKACNSETTLAWLKAHPDRRNELQRDYYYRKKQKDSAS